MSHADTKIAEPNFRKYYETFASKSSFGKQKIMKMEFIAMETPRPSRF